MKKVHYLLPCIVWFIFSCQTKHPSPENSPLNVCFSIQQDAGILPFPVAKSIPDTNVPEPEVSKSGQEGGHEFSYIEYAVYDPDTNERIRYQKFSKNDPALDDFGVYVYDNFEEGVYRVCFLTHSIDGITATGDEFGFPYVFDTFYGSRLVEISAAGSRDPVEVTLHRVVTRVDFKATDAVPEEVHSFTVSVSGIYYQFNLLTGKAGVATRDIEFPHTFSDAEKVPSARNTHAFYSFVPETENPRIQQVKLSALDEEDNSLRSRTLTQIPIQQNRIIQYKGLLYTPGMINGSFELNFNNGGQWEGTEEHDLPD